MAAGKVVGYSIEVNGSAALKELKLLQETMTKLKDEQKLLKKETKEGSTQYQKNAVALKEVGAQHRNLQKSVQTSIVGTKKLGNSYNDLTEKNRRLVAEAKKLADPLGKDAKAFNKLTNNVNRNTKALSKMDKSMGRSFRNVGNYTGGLKALGGAFLAGVVGVQAFVSGIKAGVATISNFEQANANLASILGKTRSEITALTEDAKRLGASTAFTASQVSGLQTEFSKLGFNETEILDATEATLALAAATGADLSQAATVAGATVRGFGLDASETQRVVDVMAKSFSSSALDLSKFQTAMAIVAPVAKNAGQSIEATTAQLGILADRGLDASTAATSLRNIFLENAKAGRTWEEGLELINNSTNKNVTSLELFGKRGATAATILAENSEQAQELAVTLGNAGGAAQKMADTQLNTLQGRVKILSSAWEGFILSLDDGGGAFTALSKSVVTFATDLLGLLSGVDSANVAFKEQEKAVMSLEENTIPLIDRYEELTAKTILSTKEQKELDIVIQAIAEDLPLAVTEFDKYGKAIGISATAAKELVKQQKLLLSIKNAEAIKEDEEAIIDLKRELLFLTDGLDRVNDVWGKWERRVTVGGKVVKDFIPISADALMKINETKSALELEVAARQLNISHMKGEKSELEKLIEAKKEEIKVSGGSEKEALMTKIKQLTDDLSVVLDFERKKHKTKYQLQKEAQDASEKLRQEGVKKRSDAAEDELAKTIKREQDAFLAEEDLKAASLASALETSAVISNAIFAAEQTQLERKTSQAIDATKAQYDTELAILQDRLQDGIIAESEFAQKKKALDERQAATELALKKKSFEESKSLAIVQSIINTAMAVGNALATVQPFWPAAVIAAGAATVSGIAQTAIIASRQFASGGLVPTQDGGMIEGNSHANGGVKFGAGGRMEAEGGEAIITKRATAMFKPQLSAMNVAGGGVAFAHGGTIPTSVGVNPVRQSFSQGDTQDIVQASQNIKVHVVESDITAVQNRANVVEQMGRI